MPQQEGDISWPLLRQIICRWGGSSTELAEVKHLHGGSISTTLLLTTCDGAKVVLKISPYRVDRTYAREAEQLNLLGSLGIPTPAIFETAVGTLDEPNSYLLMEYLPGMNLHQARQVCPAEEYNSLQRELAHIVRLMHSHEQPAYRQAGGEESADFLHWHEFFRTVYEPTWQEASKLKAIPIKARKLIGRLHDSLDRYIAHLDVPRLVHWDLWANNILCHPDSAGSWHITGVLDPLCKFAHSEAEIAYLDLFQTVTPAFYQAYQEKFRLDEHYHRLRKPIYQLYPLLNHVCTFGEEYLRPLEATVNRVKAFV